MKISELEAQLKELREKHGDLPCYNSICIYEDDLQMEHPDLIGNIQFHHGDYRLPNRIYIGKLR